MLILYYSLRVFFLCQRKLMVFHWSLSDSRSPELFSIFWPISTMLDGFNLFANFQLFQSSLQAFGNCSKCANYNWYHGHPLVPSVSLFASKVQVLVSLFAFFYFHFMVLWGDIWQVLFCFFGFFLLLIITRSSFLVDIG